MLLTTTTVILKYICFFKNIFCISDKEIFSFGLQGDGGQVVEAKQASPSKQQRYIVQLCTRADLAIVGRQSGLSSLKVSTTLHNWRLESTILWKLNVWPVFNHS